MIWTDERVETLRKLWAEGLSASQIAAQLGGVSRNAVIGKVHRLKLSGRGRDDQRAGAPEEAGPAGRGAKAPAAADDSQPIRAIARSARRRCRRSSMPSRIVRTISPHRRIVVVPISRNLQLIQLNERTCKWPIGDPLAEEFHFCGNDCARSRAILPLSRADRVPAGFRAAPRPVSRRGRCRSTRT